MVVSLKFYPQDWAGTCGTVVVTVCIKHSQVDASFHDPLVLGFQTELPAISKLI